MESSTTVVSTQKSLQGRSQSGQECLPLAQDVAAVSLTKIETAFSNSGLPPNKEVMGGLLAIVLAMLSEPMLGSDSVFLIVTRAKHMAEQMGVSEEVWNQVFSEVVNQRKKMRKGTPWGEFMG